MNLNKCNKLFRFGVLFSAFFTALVLIVFCPRLSATAYAESSTPETAVTTYTVTYHANGGCWWSNWSRPTYSFATKKYEQEEGKTYQIIDSKPTYGAQHLQRLEHRVRRLRHLVFPPSGICLYRQYGPLRSVARPRSCAHR